MGVNLFVEGSPSPVVISVNLPREVSTFREISEVTSALRQIDLILRKTWPKMWPSFERRRRREILVLRFSVDSPPSFQILSDPAWLAVFLVVITGYKQGKESLKEMAADLADVASFVKGLGTRQIELLETAIRITLGRLLDQAEEDSLKLARALHVLRRKLIGDAETMPEITVIDIDNKREPW